VVSVVAFFLERLFLGNCAANGRSGKIIRVAAENTGREALADALITRLPYGFAARGQFVDGPVAIFVGIGSTELESLRRGITTIELDAVFAISLPHGETGTDATLAQLHRKALIVAAVAIVIDPIATEIIFAGRWRWIRAGIDHLTANAGQRPHGSANTQTTRGRRRNVVVVGDAITIVIEAITIVIGYGHTHRTGVHLFAVDAA